MKKPRSHISDYDADDNEAHEKFSAPADWDGPTTERHCTDLLCLLMLIASWVVMTIIGVYAISNGDYRLVLFPLDYAGNVCGTDFGETDMTDFPNLVFVNSYTGGVCVKECPSLTKNNVVSDNLTDVHTLITYSGIYQTELAELDPDFIQVGDYNSSSDKQECSAESCFPDVNDIPSSFTSEGIDEGRGYAYYVGDTYELFYRCYLTLDAEERIANLTESENEDGLVADQSLNKFWNNLYGDIWTTYPYILGCGFGVSFVLSLAYIFMLRLPFLLNGLVWGSIAACIAMFAAAGYYSYNKADEWAEFAPPSIRDQQITNVEWFAYVLWVIAAILFVVACCLRKQIQLAIGCVKEAGKSINRMLLILAVPVVQSIAFVFFWIVWAFYAVNVASLGEIKTQTVPLSVDSSVEIAYRTYEFDQFVQNCGWFYLFCLYWTSEWLVAVGDMIVAVAISKWYFTRDKSELNGTATVTASILTTLAHHMGSCAYGALIIAIVKMIRSIIAKIQKEVAKMDSKIMNCVFCCCQCMFWCLEKCMKFINKNAYIQTAIFATSFCESARKAFFLILRNAARIGAVSYVSAAVLIIGKLTISVLTTGIAYFAIIETLEDDVYSYAGPLVLIFFIAYVLADMFMDVFEIAIVAILHCFVADEEMNGTARYATGGLSSWVDKNAGDVED